MFLLRTFTDRVPFFFGRKRVSRREAVSNERGCPDHANPLKVADYFPEPSVMKKVLKTPVRKGFRLI